MSAKFFLDTNIFVYSFDSRHPAKQKKAQSLIDKALSDHSGLISTQVIQEFLNVALRKFEKPLSVEESRSYLDLVLTPLCEVFPTAKLYQQALEITAETGFSFYDSLILASASAGDCKILYTEDLQNNQRVANLTIQNPFL
jgi:predicted nucleic acid-binding protein